MEISFTSMKGSVPFNVGIKRYVGTHLFMDGLSSHPFCIVQVIEEAPSPIMTPALRERMGLSAVAIGSAITYRGAGTVEFIVDDKGRYPAHFDFNNKCTHLSIPPRGLFFPRSEYATPG